MENPTTQTKPATVAVASVGVTEEHIKLVREMAAQGQYLTRSIEHYAQLLADSEARAKESLMVAYDVAVATRSRIETERDRLRDVVEAITDTSVRLLATLTAERGKVRGLREALRSIASYGDKLDGCCPYGCDTPTIAIRALAALRRRKKP